MVIHGEGVDLKAHLKVDLKVMPNSPIEILGAWERRRRWSVEEKLRIVAECDEPVPALAEFSGQAVYRVDGMYLFEVHDEAARLSD
jgi:hypothetical protein